MAFFIQVGALEEYGCAACFQDAKYTIWPYFGKSCPLETSIGIRQPPNCAVVQTGTKRRVSAAGAFPGLGIQESSGYHTGQFDPIEALVQKFLRLTVSRRRTGSHCLAYACG